MPLRTDDLTVGEVYNPSGPSTATATQIADLTESNLIAGDYTFIFRVYAYFDVDGDSMISSTYAQAQVTDDNSSNYMKIRITWSAVADAAGYAILIVQDDFNGLTGTNEYYDAGVLTTIDYTGLVHQASAWDSLPIATGEVKLAGPIKLFPAECDDTTNTWLWTEGTNLLLGNSTASKDLTAETWTADVPNLKLTATQPNVYENNIFIQSINNTYDDATNGVGISKGIWVASNDGTAITVHLEVLAIGDIVTVVSYGNADVIISGTTHNVSINGGTSYTLSAGQAVSFIATGTQAVKVLSHYYDIPSAVKTALVSIEDTGSYEDFNSAEGLRVFDPSAGGTWQSASSIDGYMPNANGSWTAWNGLWLGYYSDQPTYWGTGGLGSALNADGSLKATSDNGYWFNLKLDQTNFDTKYPELSATDNNGTGQYIVIKGGVILKDFDPMTVAYMYFCSSDENYQSYIYQDTGILYAYTAANRWINNGILDSVNQTNEQFRATYATNTIYTKLTVASNGTTTLAAVGGAVGDIVLTPTGSSTPALLTDTGSLIIGGNGVTNNEKLTFDFETTANIVAVSSTTGVTKINTALDIGMLSDSAKTWYGAGVDMSIWYDGTYGQIKTSDIAASDLRITCGTAKTLELQTAVWDDLMVQVQGSRLPASGAPTWTAFKGCEVLTFSKTATNTIHFTAQLPHTYKEGTDIEFHIHIAYPDNGAGNSRWQMTHSWANRDAAFPTETTTTAVTLASPTTADQHKLGELIATITGSGKTVSSVLLCSLSRLGGDGADDYDNVIYLVGADFHHQIDTMGSRTATAK